MDKKLFILNLLFFFFFHLTVVTVNSGKLTFFQCFFLLNSNFTFLLLLYFVQLETPCTNSLKEEGTCLSTWECIRQDGRRLGICAKGFLFGVCCGLNIDKTKSLQLQVPIQPVISTLKQLNSSSNKLNKNFSNYSQVTNSTTTKKQEEEKSPSKLQVTIATTRPIKLINTRPTIDPFSEIITTARPARTVKVLTRETYNNELTTTTTIAPTSISSEAIINDFTTTTTTVDGKKNLFSTSKSNIISSKKQIIPTTSDSVNYFAVTETNEISDNEIAIDSIDDVTTTEATNVGVVNSETSYYSTSGDNSSNNNYNVTGVTFTNAHPHPMHNYSSTQMTIESTGETVDTDNSLLLPSSSSSSQSASNTIIISSPSSSIKLNSTSNSSSSSESNDTTINLTVVPVTSPEKEKGSIEVTSSSNSGSNSFSSTETAIISTATESVTTSSISSTPTGTKVNKIVTKNETKVSTDRPYVSHLGK